MNSKAAMVVGSASGAESGSSTGNHATNEIYNNSTIYDPVSKNRNLQKDGPDTSTLKASKDRLNLASDIHELLEEPVEEMVSSRAVYDLVKRPVVKLFSCTLYRFNFGNLGAWCRHCNVSQERLFPDSLQQVNVCI